jgi:Shedu protein SduA, N-terminal/Shedu protein SduA, C-terminal
MDELTVNSTSLSSADVSDIILRTTAITRLVFRPVLVSNPKDHAAAVKGTFIFQRKGSKQTWEDIPVKPLSSLKKEEDYHLALDSSETLSLFTQLRELYTLYAEEGIPIGHTAYVRANSAIAELGDLSVEELGVLLDAHETVGSDLLVRLLSWAAGAEEVSKLVSLLDNLGVEALSRINTAVSVSGLREALDCWQKNQTNGDEEFWQTFLAQRSFLLEQLFSWPCTIIAEKAYVGGKKIQNTGGSLVDFLVKNCLTSGAALVEIKTPVKPLTGKEYRLGIPNVSLELAGAVVQVLSYKAKLSESYKMLDSAGEYEVFDTPCMVIIGKAESLNSIERRRTFELFRAQLKGVQVVTFDELFARVERLVNVLVIT